jgi:squalene-associated FAD-dependent desaturase
LSGGGPRVAVVGGGLAGISAALACAYAGAEVTLLEVRPRLGGAAYSFRRDDLWLDNGQHVFLRCCTAYRALLARLGSEHDTVLQPRLEIPVLSPGRPTAWLRRTRGPAPLHLAPALARYPHLSPRQRAGAVRAALALSRVKPDDPALDRRSFGEWLAAHGQGPAAIAALWDLIALPTLNLRADEASAALGAFVFQEGLLKQADAGDVGWARAPLSAVHGWPAERALREAGIEVRLGWRAQRVAAGHAGRLAVEAGGGDGVDADAVIVAVPHQRAGALLPEGALPAPEKLAELGTSPIVNLHVVYDRRVTDLPFAAGVGTPVQYLFDRTAGAGLTDGQYVAVSLSAAAREMGMSGDELRARYVPALAELLPRARGARIERFVVTREHAATFRAAPGVAALRPGPRTAVPGLVLAGAWTDTGWPATMEGAVRSGHAAAREALAAAGAPEPVAVRATA